MIVLSGKQIKQADAVSIRNQNISSEELMERAANKVFEWICRKYPAASTETVSVFCGPGNNGGDGLALGRMLYKANYKVKIFTLEFTKNNSSDFLSNLQKLKSNNIPVYPISSANDFPFIDEKMLVIDSIFGIGLSRTPDSWIKELIQHLNKSKATIISIDMPSGLFAEAPVMDFDAVIKASVTLTFQCSKLSFFLPENTEIIERVEVLNIGLDIDFIQSLTPLAQIVTLNGIKNQLKKRKKFSHKGTFGHVAVIGGSYGMIGAAYLTSKAAYRTGAGKVTVVVPKCGCEIIQTTLPEAMVITDIDDNEHTEIAIKEEQYSAIAIGMGIGVSEKVNNALIMFLKSCKKPMVIDADALNILANYPEYLQFIPEQSILTPHPKELAGLIGKWKHDYEKIDKVKLLSKKLNVIIVIKGAHTMTIYKDEIFINSTGNPGMATAGSGDVLSGIIAGLIAQKYSPLIAAYLGVFMHGLAGDFAQEKMGMHAMTASDLIDNLGNAFNKIKTTLFKKTMWFKI